MTREPEKGFYHHYKHDPEKGVFDYAYEVVGIAHHTEVEDFDAARMVVYRPLYESAKVYQAGRHCDVRPLGMFMEDVTKEGRVFPRFSKVTDRAATELLRAKRREMYGTN
ncbi:MAG: DUF1653 domain-containing protein [Candidatus Taylorbacteria bacterium]|nr:DUF1653 domain-containing protein [Candidatus Taylorbacteria bacterium]